MRKMKLILSCLFLLLVLTVADAAFLMDRVVAVVNDEVITWSELYRAMQADASPAVKAMGEEERKKVFQKNEAVFLNTVIGVKLQLQEAKSHGIRVSEEETKEAIENIKKKYGMTDAQFEESLKAEGYSFAEYKKRLREQITINKLINQQIRSKILVTDREVDVFMKENKEFSESEETYKIQQILFKERKDAADGPKTEERAQAVYEKILKGERFSDLAKEYSEDPSRNVGGELGFINKRNLAGEFSDALAVMKPGDVSKPFWTNAGVHIIRLEEVRAKKSGAELREEARTALTNKLFAEHYTEWMKSLREQAFIDIRL